MVLLSTPLQHNMAVRLPRRESYQEYNNRKGHRYLKKRPVQTTSLYFAVLLSETRHYTIGTFPSGPGRYMYPTGPVPPQTAQINKLIHQYSLDSRGAKRSFQWFQLGNRNSSALEQQMFLQFRTYSAGLLSNQPKNCVQAWKRHITGLPRKENFNISLYENAQSINVHDHQYRAASSNCHTAPIVRAIYWNIRYLQTLYYL